MSNDVIQMLTRRGLRCDGATGREWIRFDAQPRGADANAVTGGATWPTVFKSAVEPELVTIEQGCGHLRAISSLTPPSKRGCEDRVKVGSRWVHLRTCQTCGGTRCCDSSLNRHASKHARASGHPVIASAERG